MLRSRGDSTSSTSSSPGKLFAGIRFVLFGFDSVSEAQYRSELVRRGGIDAGRYDSSCTHVIVSGRIYDDPVCLAARNDGKTLVTEMWIDDSVDFGRVADVNRILYRPVRDLNGIPGSESLNICLTGYQRQEREDIMKMVSLMGARFSKPLIANQVTHLICYKFEGEKYELAKKVNIKLVNHRWLEDCLKDWEILPIDFYTKRSGWELEILEAEARDSEDETEDISARENRRSSIGTSAAQSGLAVSAGRHCPTENPAIASSSKDYVVEKELVTAGELTVSNNQFTTPSKEARLEKVLDVYNGISKVEEFTHPYLKGHVLADQDYITKDSANGGELDIPCENNLKKEGSVLPTTKSVTPASTLNERVNRLSYARKYRSKSISPEEPSSYSKSSPQLEGSVFRFDVDSSPSTEGRRSGKSADTQRLPPNESIENAEATGSALPQKRKVSVSTADSKSPKSSIEQSPMTIKVCTEFGEVNALPLEKIVSGLNCTSDNVNSSVLNSTGERHTISSKSKALNYRRKSVNSGQFVSGTKTTKSFPSDAKAVLTNAQKVLKKRTGNNSTNSRSTVTSIELSPADGNALRDCPVHDEQMEEAEMHLGVRKTAEDFGSLAIGSRIADEIISQVKVPEISSNGLRKSECATKHENTDIKRSEIPNICTNEMVPHRLPQDEGALSPDNRETEGKKLLSCSGVDACKRNTTKVLSSARVKKAVAKRSMSGLSKRIEGSNMIENVTVASKKALSVNTTEGKSGKMEKPCGDLLYHSVTNNNMNGAVQPSRNDVVIEECSKVAQHPMSAGKEIDVAMKETSLDSEKENKPDNGIVVSKQNSDQGSSRACKDKIELLQDKKGTSVDNSNNKQISKAGQFGSLEPAWFIVSGHRFQRKEFQTIIRRLRGRACRDSHHWSYQATHFIVPDPVRRTEKLFAAAASGRWILQTNYLTASNEAGKFLQEEAFEWYRNGLTEDGAISLEAPRKWRLLRERTGHGAFYGMRIIVYGECIAPTLDTLKRVVKAGDGIILATSPPYTRFLKTGVDFAIVSPSMPRVDAWVQEFLRYEVPCVMADYLVEYVCKPGYSLERHVLFKTHAWADKALANLLNRSEEIITDATVTSQDSDDGDDICCTVCGSRDRGEVMLICGDEGGKTGCGIGTHIDCCDPPLEAVPEGDWFCTSCSGNSSEGTLKGTKITSSKRRMINDITPKIPGMGII